MREAAPLDYSGNVFKDFFITLGNLATDGFDSTGLFQKITCEDTRCRTEFFVARSVKDARPHPCPACRSEQRSGMVRLQELQRSLEESAVRRGGSR